MYLRFVGILANILRLVVEPKRYVLEVIEHPNHSLRIWLDAQGMLTYQKKHLWDIDVIDIDPHQMYGIIQN